MVAPWLLWLFAAALFDDTFRPRPMHASALVLLTAAGLWAWTGTDPAQSMLPFRLLSFACLVGALIQAVAGRKTDLLASRRRFRMLLASGITTYALIVVTVETHQRGEAMPDAVGAAHALAVLVLGGVAALALLRPRPGLLWTAPRPDAPEPGMHVEPAVVDRLMTAVTRDRIHRTEGLTIARLAVSLCVAEHRLSRRYSRPG